MVDFQRKEEANILVDVPQEMELVAVIALGYADEKPTTTRKRFDNLVIGKK